MKRITIPLGLILVASIALGASLASGQPAPPAPRHVAAVVRTAPISAPLVTTTTAPPAVTTTTAPPAVTTTTAPRVIPPRTTNNPTAPAPAPSDAPVIVVEPPNGYVPPTDPQCLLTWSTPGIPGEDNAPFPCNEIPSEEADLPAGDTYSSSVVPISEDVPNANPYSGAPTNTDN